MNNFNVVVDKAQYGICLLDHDGLFSYVNQRFADMNGYAVEELLGKNYSFLHTAEQVKKVDALIKALRLQGSFSGQEAWFKRKDSSIYPVSLSGTLINDDKDEAVCMSIMGIDITEQKKIETALKASEKIYRLIFDNSPVGIFHFDKEGNILAYNDSFREIVGATKQELAHFNVLQDSHDEGMEVAFIACFSGMVGHFEGAFMVGAGREPKTVKIDFSPIVFSGGPFEGGIGIMQDITEQKQCQIKEQETMELKSKFTSMVSHELRTPLTAIKEGIDIVMDGSAGPVNEEQEEFLDVAKRNVDRLARLINDVLDFQKLEAGKMNLNFKQHNINDTIVEIYKTMAHIAQSKGLYLKLYLSETVPEAVYDQDKIIQVIVNLVNNALKFTREGGITIETLHKENTVNVMVKDTGPGIESKDIPRLFEQFEQLGNSKERQVGGTGLGLAISREIIHLHGGKIWAESEIGRGTTFQFILPVQERRGMHG